MSREEIESKSSDRAQTLASKAAEGETFAFVELLGLFHTFITCTARAAGLPEHDYDDLCDRGSWALYRAVQTYRPDQGALFATYAHACIRNAMCSYARRQYADAAKTLPDEFDEASDASVTEPENMMMAAEFVGTLYRCISTALSREEQTVIRHRIEGVSISESAAFLGKSVKSVENALYRARVKLRAAMEPGV